MSAETVCKLVFIVFILVLTLASSLAPMKVRGCKTNQKLLGILNSFSGGVFLAIAFVHILPETSNLYYQSKLERLLQKQHAIAPALNSDRSELSNLVTQDEINTIIEEYQSSFPLPYLLVVFGYAFILLIDRVIIDSHSMGPADGHNHTDVADSVLDTLRQS